MCLETCFAVSAGKAPEAGTALSASPQEAGAEASASQPAETVMMPVPPGDSFEWPASSQEASAADVLPMLARNVSSRTRTTRLHRVPRPY